MRHQDHYIDAVSNHRVGEDIVKKRYLYSLTHAAGQHLPERHVFQYLFLHGSMPLLRRVSKDEIQEQLVHYRELPRDLRYVFAVVIACHSGDKGCPEAESLHKAFCWPGTPHVYVACVGGKWKSMECCMEAKTARKFADAFMDNIIELREQKPNATFAEAYDALAEEEEPVKGYQRFHFLSGKGLLIRDIFPVEN